MIESVVSGRESEFAYLGNQPFLSSSVLILMRTNGISEKDLVKIHSARFREDAEEKLPDTNENLQDFIGKNYVFGKVVEIGQGGKELVRNSEGIYPLSDELLACVISYACAHSLNAIGYSGSGSLEYVLGMHLQNMIKEEKMPECAEIHIEGA